LDRAQKRFKRQNPIRQKESLDFKGRNYKLGLELLKWANKTDERYSVNEISEWNIEALVKARYVPFFVHTGGRECVDLDGDGQPLNQWPVVQCKKCGWPNEKIVSDPYKVWGPSVRGRREILLAENARYICKRRVLDLLLGVVKDQIQWGRVQLVGATKGVEEEFFWFRPLATTGRDLTIVHKEKCSACGVPLKCWGNSCLGIGSRILLEGFGDPSADLAALGSWYGDRTCPRGNDGIIREGVISGGLLAYLYNSDVKGVLIPAGGAYSIKGEEPFEKERRLANLNTNDKILKQKIKRYS
jgi:hypothetical protein